MLEKLFWAVLVCGGITAAAQPGLLLHPWYERLRFKYDTGLRKWMWTAPVLVCASCLASFWGSISFWSLTWAWNEPVTKATWVGWAHVVLGCTCCNCLLWSAYHTLLQWFQYLRKHTPSDAYPGTDQRQHQTPGKRPDQ